MSYLPNSFSQHTVLKILKKARYLLASYTPAPRKKARRAHHSSVESSRFSRIGLHVRPISSFASAEVRWTPRRPSRLLVDSTSEAVVLRQQKSSSPHFFGGGGGGGGGFAEGFGFGVPRASAARATGTKMLRSFIASAGGAGEEKGGRKELLRVSGPSRLR